MARFINLHLLNFDILVQDLICREASSVTRLNSRSPACQRHWRLLWVGRPGFEHELPGIYDCRACGNRL